MQTRSFAVSACVVLLAVTVLSTVGWSQERERGQGPRGGRGGAGGQGGFGFGGPGGFGGGDTSLALLRSEAVRKELELIDDQAAQLQKLQEELRPERPEGNFRELSREERARVLAEMREQMQKNAEKARKQLAEILLPHQLDRLEQIALQVRGTYALLDPEVAAKLNLTDEQKQQIQEATEASRASMREKMQAAFREGGGDRENIREQVMALRAEADKQVLAVLSTEQQKKFEELKGPEFDMPREGFGGRGGRGGGFGGGQGGRGGEGGRPGRPGRPERAENN